VVLCSILCLYCPLGGCFSNEDTTCSKKKKNICETLSKHFTQTTRVGCTGSSQSPVLPLDGWPRNLKPGPTKHRTGYKARVHIYTSTYTNITLYSLTLFSLLLPFETLPETPNATPNAWVLNFFQCHTSNTTLLPDLRRETLHLSLFSFSSDHLQLLFFQHKSTCTRPIEDLPLETTVSARCRVDLWVLLLISVPILF
jgi:hypothetical protein